MSAEAKALLGQVVFNDPKGFGAHAMEFGQFRARDTRELTQGCVARVVQSAGRRCAERAATPVRFDPRVADRLASFVAAKPGMSLSSAANRLVDEALRMAEHPGLPSGPVLPGAVPP